MQFVVTKFWSSLIERGGRVGFLPLYGCSGEALKHSCAVKSRATALVVVLKKLIVVNGTTAGVPLVKGVVICTGGVLDWNKNRSTGNKSLSFFGFWWWLKVISVSFGFKIWESKEHEKQNRSYQQ